jgi:hypothetical protein
MQKKSKLTHDSLLLLQPNIVFINHPDITILKVKRRRKKILKKRKRAE